MERLCVYINFHVYTQSISALFNDASSSSNYMSLVDKMYRHAS